VYLVKAHEHQIGFIKIKTKPENKMDNLIIIRGGGDLATGVAQKFKRSGFNILILESETPTAIRRSVSLCEAVYDGTKEVEDMICRKIDRNGELSKCWEEGIIPLLVDPDGSCIGKLKPAAVIDAIIAKKNTGTEINMANIVIALGPGFTAGKDVHAVIETKRGNDLGKLILCGQAEANTGVPGEIAGESIRRVVRAPGNGLVKNIKQIGDIVQQGEILLSVNKEEIFAPISGLLRGLIRDGINVKEGMKIADIDPRPDINPNTISDKARCVGGAALEAYLYLNANGEAKK